MKRITFLATLTLLAACGDTATEPALDQSPLTSSPAATAELGECSLQNINTVKKLTDCVTLDGVRRHQLAFQTIADANDGTRVAGSSGYDASVSYVAGTLEAAGYDVIVQPFSFTSFRRLGPSTLAQTAPSPTTYAEENDYLVMTYSDPGDVTAPVTSVDLHLGLYNNSTSGCEASDFAGFPAGHIALIQRGTCTFQLKAENAAAAGAVGVIVFNQGDWSSADRMDVFSGTLGTDYSGGIPVVSTSYAQGVAWDGTAGLVMRLHANVLRETGTTFNVLAETPSGDPGNVVMAGGHLDSVEGGPGIQDNGSGSAALLEVALQMASAKIKNKVRFAWWGAEEAGLLGSYHYVNSLSEAERGRIALYLNFDMIASPNFAYFVYDGNGSTFGLAGPEGSEAIEDVFEYFYESRDLPWDPTQLGGRSDYASFDDVGIPFGGIFTGAEGIKSAQQAAAHGGIAGEPFDACYHQACDTYENVSLEALDVNADAVATSVLHFAMSTDDVTGGKARSKPRGAPAAHARVDGQTHGAVR